MTAPASPRPRHWQLRPGVQSPEHFAAWMAGSVPTRFGSPTRPRCTAISRRTGERCQGCAMTGLALCWVHAGPARRPPRRVKANPALVARRALAAAQRRAWRRDPWAPGATLALPDEAEARFMAEVQRNGLAPDVTPPTVLDWLRWKARRAWLDGPERPEIWQAALQAAPGRVRAAGRPPVGWVPGDMEAARDAAPYRADVARLTSKRRKPDPHRPAFRPRADVMAPGDDGSGEAGAPPGWRMAADPAPG